ncbi:MAG: hypothetical protein ACYCQI_11300 [Gammaproteobacteria bacterium]
MNFFFQRYAFISLVFLTISFAWIIQSTLLLNVDVSWLLEASKRMLAGGSYTKDYFENNPPWILYFYAFPVMVAKIFSISIIVSLRVYVFLLAILSTLLSYYFLRQIVAQQDILLAKFLTLALVILFLILPLGELGQRDHLLFVLSVPYFLMLTLRLQDRQVNGHLAVAVGVLAGSVFLMKPYFLMALGLIEFYYFLNKKKISALFRPETLTIMAMLLVYMVLLLVRHNDYLTLVLPFAARWCYKATKNPLSIVLNNVATMSCLAVILLALATYEVMRYRQLMLIFLLAFAGFFFSYFIQHEAWFYHLLPALSLALLMCVAVLYFIIASPAQQSRLDYISLLLAGYIILMAVYLNHLSFNFSYHFTLHPVVFFGFMAAVFSFVLILTTSRSLLTPIQCVTILLLSLTIAVVFYLMSNAYFRWSELHFLLTMLVLIGSFALIFPGHLSTKLRQGFVVLLVTVAFLLPFYDILFRYNYSQSCDNNYKKLIAYLDANAAHASVYFFTSNIAHVYPVITYSQNTTTPSRFSFFWTLAGFVKQSFMPMSGEMQEHKRKDTNFLIETIVEDLSVKKPRYVFIDTLYRKNNFILAEGAQGGSYILFDYLIYFLKNPEFQAVWKNYHYKTSITTNRQELINPFMYDIKLLYKHLPNDKEVGTDEIDLYMLSQGGLEIALRNQYGDVNRITVDQDSLVKSIKKVLATKGMKMDKKTQADFFAWLSKQAVSQQFYKFDIYERRI